MCPPCMANAGADTIKLVRSLQPDILINDRTGDGGDYARRSKKSAASIWITHGNRA